MLYYYFELIDNETGEVLTYGSTIDYEAFLDRVNTWIKLTNNKTTIETKLRYTHSWFVSTWYEHKGTGYS